MTSLNHTPPRIASNQPFDNRFYPKENELFWYISRTLKVCSARYLHNKNPKNNNAHLEIAQSLNCFKTKNNAQDALALLTKALIDYHQQSR